MNTSSSLRKGFTLVEVLVVTAILAAAIAILLPAIQKAREGAHRQKCQSNLRQLGLGLHGYHEVYGRLPPATTVQDSGYLFLSWQARILPWMEQTGTWAETQAAFQQNPSFWIVPPHRVRERVIPVFICPSDGRTVGNPKPENIRAGLTHYLGISGYMHEEGLLFADSAVRWADVTDGLSQTVLVGERPPSGDERFGWWYAGIGQNYDGCADAYLSVRESYYGFRTPTCLPGPYDYLGHATARAILIISGACTPAAPISSFATAPAAFLTTPPRRSCPRWPHAPAARPLTCLECSSGPKTSPISRRDKNGVT